MDDGAELSETGRLPRPIGGSAPKRGRVEDRDERSGSGCDPGNDVGAAKDSNEGGVAISILATA